MNERIKQLATQATRQYSPTYYTQEWIQGFAELIVQECVSQLYELTPPKISNENHQKLVDTAYMLAVDNGVDKIKQHFGVKE